MVLIFCLFFFTCYHYCISDLEVKKVSKGQKPKTLTDVFKGFLLLFFSWKISCSQFQPLEYVYCGTFPCMNLNLPLAAKTICDWQWALPVHSRQGMLFSMTLLAIVWVPLQFLTLISTLHEMFWPSAHTRLTSCWGALGLPFYKVILHFYTRPGLNRTHKIFFWLAGYFFTGLYKTGLTVVSIHWSVWPPVSWLTTILSWAHFFSFFKQKYILKHIIYKYKNLQNDVWTESCTHCGQPCFRHMFLLKRFICLLYFIQRPCSTFFNFSSK